MADVARLEERVRELERQNLTLLRENARLRTATVLLLPLVQSQALFTALVLGEQLDPSEAPHVHRALELELRLELRVELGRRHGVLHNGIKLLCSCRAGGALREPCVNT